MSNGVVPNPGITTVTIKMTPRWLFGPICIFTAIWFIIVIVYGSFNANTSSRDDRLQTVQTENAQLKTVVSIYQGVQAIGVGGH